MTSPSFGQVTVLAPGLLGASVLMAAKQRGVAQRTVAWARREATREQCAQSDWCDAVFATAAEAVKDADIVVLCPPVEHIIPLLKEIAPHLKPGATVTDVGSTKASICAQAAEITLGQNMPGEDTLGETLPGEGTLGKAMLNEGSLGKAISGKSTLGETTSGEGVSRASTPDKNAAGKNISHEGAFGKNALAKGVAFIGSHPMAGSEKTGLENGRADLFANRTCLVIEPIGDALLHDTDHFEKICAFWRALGMSVFTPSADEHDRLVAETSHLPHLLASALSAWLARDASAPARRNAAGPGLRDTTRIAAGDPDLWLSIIRENRSEIIRALEGFSAATQTLLAALKTNDDTAVRQLLADGKAARDLLDLPQQEADRSCK